MYIEKSNVANIPNPVAIAAEFFNRLDQLNRQEFFNFDDLFDVKEVVDNMLALERDLVDPCETGYSQLPRKGFRFAYYGMLADDAQLFDMNGYHEIEKQAKELGYHFFSDEAYIYVGIPENQFLTPYVGKLKTAFEDA